MLLQLTSNLSNITDLFEMRLPFIIRKINTILITLIQPEIFLLFHISQNLCSRYISLMYKSERIRLSDRSVSLNCFNQQATLEIVLQIGFFPLQFILFGKKQYGQSNSDYFLINPKPNSCISKEQLSNNRNLIKKSCFSC